MTNCFEFLHYIIIKYYSEYFLTTESVQNFEKLRQL